MTVTSHADVARRLLANVDAGTSDQAESQMKVPIAGVPRPAALGGRDGAGVPALAARRRPVVRHRATRATSTRLEIADRPILVVRGDDGVARTFLNVCRHRGAQVAEGCGHTRRFTCPYHAWVYDTKGRARRRARQATRSASSTSAVSSSCRPTSGPGVVLAVLTPDLDFDPDEWLAGMDDALAMLRLDELHRYPVRDGARQPELEAHRRRLRRRLPHRLPPQLDDRREGDHQPQHLRLLRSARPHRVRQQADQPRSATVRRRSGRRCSS